MNTPQEYQDISDYMTEQIDKIVVDVELVGHGWAVPGEDSVTVPSWIMKQQIEYQYYYVIHEVCHILANTHLHNKIFKVVEKKWLAEFDLYPAYGKRNTTKYPTIMCSAAGEIFWQR